MLGPQCRVTQPVSDPKGAQVINLKAACRGVPEVTQSRWGMGNSPQVAGPGRGGWQGGAGRGEGAAWTFGLSSTFGLH